MAVYKVAQDVEADDKLIGPFSFRQFIYLIIVAISITLAWGLAQLFVPLAIIPLPIIVFFGALALPLRKDQPMEIYMAALLSYYLKPRRRLWIPDGIESLVEITAPKVVEVQRTKDLSQTEAERRLSYLANIADTEGWAIRHAATPGSGSNMVSDVFLEAQQTVDIMDTQGGIAQSIDTMISQSDARRRQEVVEHMRAPQTVPSNVATQVTPSVQTQVSPPTPPVADPYASLTIAPAQAAAVTASDLAALHQASPYPSNIHQSVIQPLVAQSPPLPTVPPQVPVQPQVPIVNPETNTTPTTSGNGVDPDIINLANNTDLSIETIAHEAERRKKKRDDEQEVVISLH